MIEKIKEIYENFDEWCSEEVQLSFDNFYAISNNITIVIISLVFVALILGLIKY